MKIPKLYCDISLCVRHENTASVSAQLDNMGLQYSIVSPMYFDEDLLKIASVAPTELWYLDDALALLFQQIKNHVCQLKEMLHSLNVVAQLNIAFVQYGTYPALMITGENMRYIRELGADISIDPYDAPSGEFAPAT